MIGDSDREINSLLRLGFWSDEVDFALRFVFLRVVFRVLLFVSLIIFHMPLSTKRILLSASTNLT